MSVHRSTSSPIELPAVCSISDYLPLLSEDTPRPPELTTDLEDRLFKINKLVLETERESKKATCNIHSRRSRLFENVDPVLLPLKLLPMELSNVHSCIRQALEWNFLPDEEKVRLEEAFRRTCAEIIFATQHLAIEEQNYFFAHKEELIYTANMRDRVQWENEVLESDDPEMLKVTLELMFPLSEQLKADVQRLEKGLQTLTKLRIRYKQLLYNAMETALEVDEARGKECITMNALLHPAWN